MLLLILYKLICLPSITRSLKSKVFLHFEEVQIWILDSLLAINLKILFTNYKLTSHRCSRYEVGSRRWAWGFPEEVHISYNNTVFHHKKPFLKGFVFLQLLFTFQSTIASALPTGIKNALNSQLHFKAKSTTPPLSAVQNLGPYLQASDTVIYLAKELLRMLPATLNTWESQLCSKPTCYYEKYHEV